MFPFSGHTQSEDNTNQCGTVADPDSYLYDFTFGNNDKLIDIIMYPNPAENRVTVIIPSDDLYNLSVININGQAVHSQNNHKEVEYTINTATFNSGIYFVRLTSSAGTTLTKRLIIKK